MILQDPHDALHARCEPVTFPEAKRIAKTLRDAYQEVSKKAKDTLVVGLAAPQIGIPKRMFAMYGIVFINPSFTAHGPKLVDSAEGCLSLPDTYHPKRYDTILATWTDEARRLRRELLEGRDAVVFQHEFDHLEGRLCNEL